MLTGLEVSLKVHTFARHLHAVQLRRLSGPFADLLDIIYVC